ncbi:MAG: hypothetical protein R2837_00005 [Aliarcobacter sp.]
MFFREFENQIKPLQTFNLNDIRKIEPFFHRTQLNDWILRGYIKPFANGYYILSNTIIDENLLFMFANMIYEPSYISLESALAYYQFIPESVLSITSISTLKTKSFNTDFGNITYRSIKPKIMFGYENITISQNIKFKIAKLEKAILDYLYLNSTIKTIEDFESLRWNKNIINNLNKNNLFIKYQRVFNNKALNNRINIMMEYANA